MPTRSRIKSPSPPKRRPGRPKKAVVPSDPPPPEPISATEAQRLILAQAAARAHRGERLSHAEAKCLREAWLHDMAEHLWPSWETAAAELSISVSTLRSFRDQGCPGLPGEGDGHAPIAKARVLSWLLRRAHDRGAATFADAGSIEEQELRWKKAKADQLEGTLQAEAIATAESQIRDLFTRLRHEALHVWPETIVHATCAAIRAVGDIAHLDHAALLDDLESIIDQHLRGIVSAAQQRGFDPSPDQPTRAPIAQKEES